MGGILLAAGGGGFLATRKTKPLPGRADRFRVLSAEEAAVVLALADRLVPERDGFPRPFDVDVPGKVDRAAARMHPAAQHDLKRTLHLFEWALTGFLFEGVGRPFSESAPDAQDRRMAGWARSRLAFRRTGWRALRSAVYEAYYASPETYRAVGYGGPPAPEMLARMRRPEEARPADPPRDRSATPRRPGVEPAKPGGVHAEPRPATRRKPEPVAPKEVDSELMGPAVPEPPAESRPGESPEHSAGPEAEPAAEPPASPEGTP